MEQVAVGGTLVDDGLVRTILQVHPRFNREVV